MRVACLLLCASTIACSNAGSPTGLSIEIDYGDGVVSVAVSGDAEATARAFGPYVLSSTALVSGGTVGLLFDPSDAGGARVCAEARDASGAAIASACGLFDVRAGEVGHGTLTLRAGAPLADAGAGVDLGGLPDLVAVDLAAEHDPNEH
jgi:hypothetical protein